MFQLSALMSRSLSDVQLNNVGLDKARVLTVDILQTKS